YAENGTPGRDAGRLQVIGEWPTLPGRCVDYAIPERQTPIHPYDELLIHVGEPEQVLATGPQRSRLTSQPLLLGSCHQHTRALARAPFPPSLKAIDSRGKLQYDFSRRVRRRLRQARDRINIEAALQHEIADPVGRRG